MAKDYTQIVFQLGELHKKLKRLQSGMMKDYGISLQEYHILAALRKRHSASQNELAELLGVDKALISRQIGTMEQKGLISSVSDPGCRRKNLLTLSESSLALIPRLDELHERGLEHIFSGIDEGHLQIFNSVLEGLVSKI